MSRRVKDSPRLNLKLSGGELAYTDDGEGPVLVALHGCPGSVRDWRWIADGIRDVVRLVSLDLPGFGETPLTVYKDATFKGRVAWLMKVLDGLGVKDFAVMGHSAGGMLAIEAAARHPERVRGLALLASPGLTVHKALRENKGVRALAPILRVPLLGGALVKMIRPGFERSGFRGMSDESIFQTLQIISDMSFERQSKSVASLSCPCYVAWAKNDPLIEDVISVALSDACPGGPRSHFSDGGHNIQRSQAEALAGVLRDWVPSLMS